MRQGNVFRRCTRCNRTVDGRRCSHCGATESTWAFRVDLAPPGAPRRQRSRQGFATKAEVLDALAQLQAEARDGTAVARSSETLATYLDRWLATVRPPRMTERSHHTAALHCRVYLVPLLGAVPVQALDRASVKDAYARLRAGGGRGGRPLADATVHRIHTTLRRALRDAVDDGLLRSNPAAGAHTAPSHAAQPEVATWTADDLSRFLAWATTHDTDWARAWHLVAHTGLRRSEVAALGWRAVDLDAATLRVTRAKTARGRRTIDLDPGTVALLREHRAQQRRNRLAAGPAWQEHDAVLAHPDGSPIHPNSVSRAFTRAVEHCQRREHQQAEREQRPARPVLRITLHALRHTHATLLLAAGVPLHVVSRRLGHASEAFTAQVYAHVLPQQGEQAAAAFAALVADARQ